MAVTIAAGVFVGEAPAFADGASDDVAARALFDDARSLMQAGRFAEACPRFEESGRLAPGIGTRFNLADCYEHAGRTASAWAIFLDVAGAARMKHQDDREKVARERAAALEPRLVRLVIVVPTENRPLGLEIQRDGTRVGEAQWGVGVPADPGAHLITATAPGRKKWVESANVAGEKALVSVTVPTLALDPDAREGPGSREAPIAAVSGLLDPATEPGRGDRQRVVALVAGGLGVVSLGVGAYFGLRSISKRDAASPHCTGDTCDPDGIRFRQEAINAGSVGTVAFVVGGVGVAAGILLWLTAPSSPRSKKRALQVAPEMSASRAGVLVSGSF